MKRTISQRIGDRLLWWACILAARACRVLPSRLCLTRFASWLGGWASLYSYSTDYADYIETLESYRAGRTHDDFPSSHREGHER